MKTKKNSIFRSIKAQLLLVISLILILLTVGILGFVSTILSREYDKDIAAKSETTVSLISHNLENFLSKAYAITTDLATSSDVISMEREKQAPALAACAERNEFIEVIFIRGNDGEQTGRSKGDYSNRADRWWFPIVHNEGREFISQSYFSVSLNAPVTSVFMPIRKNNQIVGSIGMDIKLNYIQDLIAENSDAENGQYCFIVDGDGTVLAHPDSSFVEEMYNYKTLKRTVTVKDANGNPVKDAAGVNKTAEENIEVSQEFQNVIANVMDGNEGSTYFKENGNGFYAAYSPIILDGQSDSWSIVMIQEEDAAKQIITTIIRTAGIVGIILLVLALVAVIIYAGSLTRPIIRISELLSQASQGDFTGSYHSKAKNEIGVLAKSFNEMSSNISGLLNQTTEITNTINDSLIVLTDKSSTATQVAQDIRLAVGEILAGSTEQAKDAEKSALMSADLNDQFTDLSQKTSSMVEEAKQAAELTNSSAERMNELKEKNKLTYDIVGQASDVINNLNDESHTIGTILDALKDISSQTNLLSLNASIEAARAGEHGKGFAVVAHEIQQLSVASADSTDNISKIIAQIQSEISSSVEMMEAVKAVSTEQSEAVQNVNDAFMHIISTTKNIVTFIDDIEKFVAKMQENNTQVASSIDNIAAISEETAACTETATNSVQNQTTEIEHIFKQTEELKKQSELLTKELNKFIIHE